MIVIWQRPEVRYTQTCHLVFYSFAQFCDQFG